MAGSSAPINPPRLAEEFARQLTAVLEMMAGEVPIVTFAAHQPGEPTGRGADENFLWWEQSFSPGADRRIWIGASQHAWEHIGKAVLDAAEAAEQDPGARRATYLEIVNQTLSGLSAAVSKELKREVSPVDGREATPDGGASFSFDVTVRDGSALLVAIFSPAWSEAGTADISQPAQPARPSLPAPCEPSKPNTIDLLLDVELPVSISFGRTQLPLKDVIKLSTGSIVELNRAVSEPVEVIVNNCVIARAEVVVVEGNFGIRIRQVVSRQERLRTLN